MKVLLPQCRYVRIWSEIVVGETHSSLDEPPETSMFVKAGNNPVARRKDTADAATAIASALSPPPNRQGSSSCGRSPARIIDDGRSKCYEQLSKLSNLRDDGIISEEEYLTEKGARKRCHNGDPECSQKLTLKTNVEGE